MSHIKRFEVHSKKISSLNSLKNDASKYLDIHFESIHQAKVYWLYSAENLDSFDKILSEEEVLHDSVIENLYTNFNEITPHWDSVIEVKFKPGVTDNAAHSTLDAVRLVTSNNPDLQIFTGHLYFLKGDLSVHQLNEFANEFLGNSLLNAFTFYNRSNYTLERFTRPSIPIVKREAKESSYIDIKQNIEKLIILNKENCWALEKNEIQQIKNYFKQDEVILERISLGLSENPTDVEMEIIAQSWSEHCKHKIFAADINYSENITDQNKKIGKKKIQSLYKSYIKKATFDIQKNRKIDWLISVFSDNAGIVRFDKNIDLCIKVETHNSPSALDPYGGALTGILGVNRDILGCGIGAKPIANTDVFCFAHESLIEKHAIKLPKGLKHPKRILQGVHKGVEDGGNKSGIPTVNGSIFFDDDYAGKPLVYVGTVGVMPQSTKHYLCSAQKAQKIGDKIIMVGGKIGADGIHGATFSSLELNESSPATAVQIGDPLTQKKVMDFMLEARNLGLYSSVTDNGAGGLSSSIGEMAQLTNGADIDLALAPTKYPGLSPFEIMISESQERMSFAVPVEHVDDFQKLAKLYKVDSTVLGEFTNTGKLVVRYKEKLVSALDLEFLHESLIPMELEATFDANLSTTTPNYWHQNDLRAELPEQFIDIIHALLSRPNIASKEELVRQYDHEVQAATVVKPFIGPQKDGPSDAGVIWLAPHGGEENNAIAISNGLQPLYSHQDAYLMAVASVDEAVRNAIATGADPEKIVLLDNFCWPDPLPSKKNPQFSHKMAQLVRACEGLYDIATQYGMPFVSGKDSMKNDYSGIDENGETIKISVPPTLLVTAMGQIPIVEKSMTTHFKKSNDLIYLVGKFEDNHFTFSEFSRTFKLNEINPVKFNFNENLNLYKIIYSAIQKDYIQSVHDISEGGAIVALIESSIGGKFGMDIKIHNKHPIPFLVNEGIGQFVVSVKPENQESFESLFAKDNIQLIGKTTQNYNLKIESGLFNINSSLINFERSWKNQEESRHE